MSTHQGFGQAVVCAAFVSSLVACETSRSKTEEVKVSPRALGAAVTAARVQGPPTSPFVAPAPFKLSGEAGPPIQPPDLAKEAWRAIVNQYSPHQKKTPHWQPLPADQTVEIQMPQDSRYRCIVNPVQVAAMANDFGTKLKGWSLTRIMLCSSDDFASWMEFAHRLRIGAEGSREVEYESEALLRERAGEITRKTVVRMRSEKRRIKATTGPPQILKGVQVDD